MPSLSQMKYIVSVYETKSFSRAAKESYVSQPSLSMQIQKAEEELGVQIFDRNAKPIQPTEKGGRLIEQMKIILSEARRLDDLSQLEAGEVSGSFELAVIPTVAPYVLPKFLQSFHKQVPKVELKIFEKTTSEIIHSLKNKDLDAAILATPLNEKDLIEVPLYYEPFYLLAHTAHPLLKKKVLNEADVSRFPIWLLNEGHCFRTQTLSFCSNRPNEEVLPNIHYEGGSIHTLIQVVKQSQGCTLIPHMALGELSKSAIEKNVRSFKKPQPSREISLAFHKSQWKKDILEEVEKIVIKQTEAELLDFKNREILEVQD